MHGRVHDQHHFLPIQLDNWRGLFLQSLPLPRPWSSLNNAAVSTHDCQTAWPRLLNGIDGSWPRLKSDHSGLVAAGELELAGRLIEVVVKRPQRTRPTQWVIDLFRPARARRSWLKTWKLFVRGLPTEIPLLVLERRSGPVVTDNLVVFERVPGTMIERLELNPLSDETRRSLLHEVGTILRTTERLGFAHFDAKTSNWIAFPGGGDDGRLRPVMLDCDGVRHHPAPGAGLRRFLKALARHPDFRPHDAADVCGGYAPAAWPRRVQRLHDRYAGRR